MEPMQLQELEQRGWTVVRGLVPRDLTSQARELVDAIIGGSSGVESVPTDRGQPGPWPTDGGALPVITSSAFKHSINPPIDDAAFGHEGLLAKLLLPMVGVNRQLLRCEEAQDGSDSATGGLKLLQQFFRRTDVGPERHGCSDGPPPNAWHLDQGFLPRHYAARPRQMFYHTILALTDVKRDGGAFFASPSSLARARAITGGLNPAEESRIVRQADETRTRLRQVLLPQLSNTDAVEVHFDEGDMLVLDPMLLHSASANGGAIPSRHVLFTTFFHESAIGTTLAGLPDRWANLLASCSSSSACRLADFHRALRFTRFTSPLLQGCCCPRAQVPPSITAEFASTIAAATGMGLALGPECT